MHNNTQTVSVLADADKNGVVLVWGLYLGTFIIPLLVVVGVIIAYLKRGEAATDAARTHYQKAIGLFWMSLIVGIIGAALTALVVGFPILVAVAIWYLIVAIKGLMRALDGKPYA